MKTPHRIGIVGANGMIGGALARAMVETGLLPPSQLTLSCRSAPPGWLPEAVWTHDNQALADASDTVILSVRPEDWPRIGLSAPGKLVVSVMAAVPMAEIVAGTGTDRVVRALPNAAAEVGASYTPWTGSAAVTDADRALVRQIFATCGTEDEVAREADVDYLSGLSGTGPAYPALLAVAMMRDAIARGLAPEVAHRAVVGVLVGTGRLFEKPGADPSETVATLVGYRGVTAAGIDAMRAGGFDDLVGAGLSAALARALDFEAGQG